MGSICSHQGMGLEEVERVDIINDTITCVERQCPEVTCELDVKS